MLYCGAVLVGPHAVDQALCLFGWDRTPEIFCRMDSRMHGFEGDALRQAPRRAVRDGRQALGPAGHVAGGVAAYPNLHDW